MTPEAKVKQAVRKLLIAYGAYYVMPVTGGYGASGAPDFLVCYQGQFIGIECKAGRGRLTALQERNREAIQAQGGVALVINEYNVHDVEATLNALKAQGEKSDE